MYEYQRWLGQKETKPVWGVPQWFYDADSFWSRWATEQEAVVLALLRINHGAMGIVGWLFPTSPGVEKATTALATVLARADVTRLLVDGTGQRLKPMGSGAADLDVAAWVAGDEVLVVVVWPQYAHGEGGTIQLPTGGRNITHLETAFGEGWYTHGAKSGVKTSTLEKRGFAPLEVSMLKATLGGY
jgi:hypothetical protein